MGEGEEGEVARLDPATIEAHIDGLRIALKYAPDEQQKENINAHIDGLLIALKYARTL